MQYYSIFKEASVDNLSIFVAHDFQVPFKMQKLAVCQRLM
jgi:hypothetical protein